MLPTGTGSAACELRENDWIKMQSRRTPEQTPIFVMVD
jgi:hypothetical protein